VARFQIIRQMAAGFGDDLYTSFNKPLLLPVFFESCDIRPGRQFANALHGLDHVPKTGNV
jgi:hypothetical protein